jgi:FkbM family methyltransferase
MKLSFLTPLRRATSVILKRPGIGKLLAGMTFMGDDVSLIQETLNRYFESGDRSDNLVSRDPGEFEVDGRPEHIRSMLARGELHDEDYIIFRAFTDPSETILDVGASWGYSAGSIWASGAKCSILSFEPLLLCRDCLDQVRQLNQDRYDFRIVGLGSETGTVRFVTPIVNGAAITALTSADPSIHRKGLPQNIRDHIDRWMGGVPDATIRLYEFLGSIRRLDDELTGRDFTFTVKRIAAIKIDAEGYERQVLEGSRETVGRHKPLIMVESGNRTPGVQDMLIPLGYFYTERSGDRLVPVSGATNAINGFFVHRDNTARYNDAGILRNS